MTLECIHLGQKLDPAVLESITDIICGDNAEKYPVYRSSTYLTKFFHDSGINAAHDGSTRKWWVLGVLEELSSSDIEKVILRLADIREYKGDKEKLKLAVKNLNQALSMDGYKISYKNNRPILQFSDEETTIDDSLFQNGSSEESEFLKKEYSDTINLTPLNLDVQFAEIISDRIEEIKKCLASNCPLGSIFLIGSTLEGILLDCAIRHKKQFLDSQSAPKKNDKTKNIYDWRLAELIDVSSAIGFIGLDVKKFSHALRDFRNYIHPYAQMVNKFSPDNNTASICWQVFKAAIDDLSTHSE